MQFHIANMSCGGCARSVTNAIHEVDPAAKVEIDLDSRAVTITSTTDTGAIAAKLADVGYPPSAAA